MNRGLKMDRVDIVDINAQKPYREGTHQTFTSSENRCTHIGKNPGGHSVRQFKVDGEVFPKGTSPQRCDYLLLNDTEKTSYYIELKGSDIPKAVRQIDSTIALIRPSIPDYKIFRRIVYRSSTHKITESSVVKWKLLHKGTVRIERDQIKDKIS